MRRDGSESRAGFSLTWIPLASRLDFTNAFVPSVTACGLMNTNAEFIRMKSKMSKIVNSKNNTDQ